MKIYTTINPDSLSNIYLIKSDKNNNGILIDPGSFSQNVYQTLKRTDIDIKKIIII